MRIANSYILLRTIFTLALSCTAVFIYPRLAFADIIWGIDLFRAQQSIALALLEIVIAWIYVRYFLKLKINVLLLCSVVVLANIVTYSIGRLFINDLNDHYGFPLAFSLSLFLSIIIEGVILVLCFRSYAPKPVFFKSSAYMNAASYLIILVFFIVSLFQSADYRKHRLRNATLNADVKNAWIAAQSYFRDYPDAVVNLDKLKSYGFEPRIDPLTSGPDPIQIIKGTKNELTIRGSHPSLDKIYTVYPDGRIEFEYK